MALLLCSVDFCMKVIFDILMIRKKVEKTYSDSHGYILYSPSQLWYAAVGKPCVVSYYCRVIKACFGRYEKLSELHRSGTSNLCARKEAALSDADRASRADSVR